MVPTHGSVVPLAMFRYIIHVISSGSQWARQDWNGRSGEVPGRPQLGPHFQTGWCNCYCFNVKSITSVHCTHCVAYCLTPRCWSLPGSSKLRLSVNSVEKNSWVGCLSLAVTPLTSSSKSSAVWRRRSWIRTNSRSSTSSPSTMPRTPVKRGLTWRWPSHTGTLSWQADLSSLTCGAHF